MIKSNKRLLHTVSEFAKAAENEAEKASRKFFGTFIDDIKSHWSDLSTNKIKTNNHNHVSQLTSSI